MSIDRRTPEEYVESLQRGRFRSAQANSARHTHFLDGPIRKTRQHQPAVVAARAAAAARREYYRQHRERVSNSSPPGASK